LKEIDPKDDVPQKNEAEENVELVEGENTENEGTGNWKIKQAKGIWKEFI